jgi:hypothetical protein
MFKSQKQASPFVAFARAIGEQILNQGASLSNKSQTTQMLSFESLAVDAQQDLAHKAETVSADVKEAIHGLKQSLNMEGYDEGSNELEVASQAAACIMMAAGDPVAYAQKAYTVETFSDTANYRAAALNLAGTDYRTGQPAMEAFDERELSTHLPFSVAFAAFAARQDEFAEAFFPTVVITPDQAGLDIEITIPKVFTNGNHPANGVATDFGKRNLIEAAVNFEILKDEATKLVPAVAVDGSNAAIFVPEAKRGNRFIRVAGVDVPTRPLAVGKEINLISASAYAPLLGNGVLNHTDAVDSSIVLEDVLISWGDAGDAGVKFDTLHLPRNAFNKSVEGNYREMQLNFGSKHLIVDATKEAVDGTVPDAFAAVVSNNYKVYLDVSLAGSLNTEFSTVKLGSFPVTVDKILDANGNEVGLSAGAGAAVKAALEAGTVIGYTLKANRTNSNLRTRGHVVDTTVERERHTIPLGSPIIYPSPVHATGRDSDIKVAINAARFRNSNMAVTALLSYQDALAAVVKGPKRTDGIVPGIAGAGRWVVQPWYESQKLDVSASMTSDKSYERAADVSLTLVNAIRDMAYRMYRDSWYQAALDSASGGSGEKPTLLIGTDSVIERHLMVSGDDRTFGTAFDKFKVVSSLDKRVYGKIFLTFTRGSADPSDVLSFGTHAWMPELTSSLPINRAGATYREAMVQPRNLHVPKLPILGVIEVQNLSKALTFKTEKVQVGRADITNPYLPAL